MTDESRDRQPKACRRRVLWTVSKLAALGVLGTGASTTVVDGSDYRPNIADGAVVQRLLVTIEASDVRGGCLTVT